MLWARQLPPVTISLFTPRGASIPGGFFYPKNQAKRNCTQYQEGYLETTNMVSIAFFRFAEVGPKNQNIIN